MTVAPWPSDDRGACAHCGAHVSARFRRVYGDADRRAHRCPECDSWPRISEGSAAGLDVEIPDPEEAMTQATLGEFEPNLSVLTPAEREAYETVRIDGTGVREYARQTERQPGTIGNLLAHAEEKLAESEGWA